MQANWEERYLNQMGYFSHVNAGSKLSHSGKIFHLGEMSYM